MSSPCTFIELTHQDDAWLSNGVHECEGWIARWQYGAYSGAHYAPTRKKAYRIAYMHRRRAAEKDANNAMQLRELNRMVLSIRMAIDGAVACGIPRRVAVGIAKEKCK